MNTKKRILDEALTLFAEKGYANVYVGEIAEAVGIKAPSLYKHYKSKQDIFNAILEEMKENYETQARALGMNGEDAFADMDFFQNLSEDGLVKAGLQLFSYFLHDEYVSRFRKMLTIEQFHDSELATLCTKQYVDGPLAYQTTLFQMLCGEKGILRKEKPDIMALQFYAPIYLLLTMCDREPAREEEAMVYLERHIGQFQRIYQPAKEEMK